jgi:hypothetical protein
VIPKNNPATIPIKTYFDLLISDLPQWTQFSSTDIILPFEFVTFLFGCLDSYHTADWTKFLIAI